MNWIITLLNPMYWIQNNRYSKQWDKHLNRLMETHKFTEVSEYTAKIGDVTVWISNHPYASFTPYNGTLKVRPSRATIRKAMEKLLDDAYHL